MIYLYIFLEFMKIGAFAIGGGLVTIPFLFELVAKYSWISKEELVGIIGIVQSLPGAMGVNLATFVGYSTAGFWSGVLAGVSLTIPPVLIILFFAKYLKKYNSHPVFQKVLSGIRPAVIALILFASFGIAKVVIVDIKSLSICCAAFVLMCVYKKGPAFYIFLGAIIGLIFKL